MYLGYTTNNQHVNFPPLMSDGRSVISSWQPESWKNNMILQKNGIQSNWQYRQYLARNAEQLRQENFIESCNDVGYYARYDQPMDQPHPFSYSSILDKSKPVGFQDGDLKDIYVSREQLNARKISPILTQEELHRPERKMRQNKEISNFI